MQSFRILAVAALPFSVLSSVCFSPHTFLHFNDGHTVPSTLFTYLCATWNSESLDHRTISVSWNGNRKDVTRSPESFYPAKAPSVRSQVWFGWGEMFFSIPLAQAGAVWKKADSSRDHRESVERSPRRTWCSAEMEGSFFTAAAPSYTRQMLNKTLKWKLLCSCLS